jgi:hypothetical protein
MPNLPISGLPSITGRTLSDLLAIVQSGVTSNITVDSLFSEQVYNAGNVTGPITVDLSNYRWYIFTLTGNVDVTLTNQRAGEIYLFWVYSNGNFAVTDMILQSGGDVFSVGGSLPNPANNAWNLYQAYTINGDLILTEIGNFSAI